jgi:hypothetical protein
MKQDSHAEDARRGLHLDRPGPHGGAIISVVNTAQPPGAIMRLSIFLLPS